MLQPFDLSYRNFVARYIATPIGIKAVGVSDCYKKWRFFGVFIAAKSAIRQIM